MRLTRGREVRANVAGIRPPTFAAADAHGNLALAVRGGTALLHMLEIRRVGRPVRLLPWAWGAIVGAAPALVRASASGARSVSRCRAAVAVTSAIRGIRSG